MKMMEMQNYIKLMNENKEGKRQEGLAVLNFNALEMKPKAIKMQFGRKEWKKKTKIKININQSFVLPLLLSM